MTWCETPGESRPRRWWTGSDLGVRDGDDHLTIRMGKIPTVDVVGVLRLAVDVLAEDPAHSDALRTQPDAFNERLEATMPRERAAIHGLPDIR